MSCPMRWDDPDFPREDLPSAGMLCCLLESFAETSVVLVSASSVRRGFGGLGPVDFPGVGKHFLLCPSANLQTAWRAPCPTCVLPLTGQHGRLGRQSGRGQRPPLAPHLCVIPAHPPLGSLGLVLAPRYHPLQFGEPSSESRLCSITELEFHPHRLLGGLNGQPWKLYRQGRRAPGASSRQSSASPPPEPHHGR